MTLYSVTWIDKNGQRQYARPDTLSEAKKIMRQHPGATGSKTHVWSNGDWGPAGEIVLKGSNKYIMTGTRTEKASYH